MSNRTDRPSTDRPTATYPTADHLAHLEREEEAHRERLADLWADRTPTEELPAVAPSKHEGAAPTSSPRRRHEQAPLCQDMQSPLCQDMGRPRWLPAWHPSFMQLAIGAALVAALLGFCNVLAVRGFHEQLAHPRASSASAPSSTAPRPVDQDRPEAAPAPAPAPAHTTPQSGQPSSPRSEPEWVTRDTGAPYSKDDPAASPLSLPRCTTSPDTPLPCLAWNSADSRHVTVLEEDASLTGLDRR